MCMFSFCRLRAEVFVFFAFGASLGTLREKPRGPRGTLGVEVFAVFSDRAPGLRSRRAEKPVARAWQAPFVRGALLGALCRNLEVYSIADTL